MIKFIVFFFIINLINGNLFKLKKIDLCKIEITCDNQSDYNYKCGSEYCTSNKEKCDSFILIKLIVTNLNHNSKTNEWRFKTYEIFIKNIKNCSDINYYYINQQETIKKLRNYSFKSLKINYFVLLFHFIIIIIINMN